MKFNLRYMQWQMRWVHPVGAPMEFWNMIAFNSFEEALEYARHLEHDWEIHGHANNGYEIILAQARYYYSDGKRIESQRFRERWIAAAIRRWERVSREAGIDGVYPTRITVEQKH